MKTGTRQMLGQGKEMYQLHAASQSLQTTQTAALKEIKTCGTEKVVQSKYRCGLLKDYTLLASLDLSLHLFSYLDSFHRCCCFAQSDISELLTPTSHMIRPHDYCGKATNTTVVASPCEKSQRLHKTQLAIHMYVQLWQADKSERFPLTL